jgi:hypothetical protein
MKQPRQLHRYHLPITVDGTRPGANKLTIDDSFASQPVADMTLVSTVSSLWKNVSLAAGRLTSSPEPRSFDSCLARAGYLQSKAQ